MNLMDPVLYTFLAPFFGGGTGPKTTGSSFLAGASSSGIKGKEEEWMTIFVRFVESRSESVDAWMLASLTCSGLSEGVDAGCVYLDISG
jgi:hypothetical protein